LVFSSSYNGTAGSLTLNQNSIINLGSDPGGVVIRFSDIVNLGTYTLSIYNWTGETLWSGTDRDNTDQFYVTADISSNLGQISFYSGLDNNSFLGTGFQLSGSGFYNNQVIPVPEPETYATALLLLLGASLYFRRQKNPPAPCRACVSPIRRLYEPEAPLAIEKVRPAAAIQGAWASRPHPERGMGVPPVEAQGEAAHPVSLQRQSLSRAGHPQIHA
jgi:hypothetical protein